MPLHKYTFTAIDRVCDNRQHPPAGRLGHMSTGVPHLQRRCIDANKDTGDFVSVDC